MKARILIVDDEQDMVELLSFNLRRRSYDVIVARTGTDALSKARTHLPDLVLLDLMLDGLDGLTVCEFLRRQPSTADIPVIMITALSGQIPRVHGLLAGANEFVTKPFDVQDLMNRVGILIEAQQQKLRLRAKEEGRENPQSTAR
jgi:DNA-binding response OmpR family regulator